MNELEIKIIQVFLSYYKRKGIMDWISSSKCFVPIKLKTFKKMISRYRVKLDELEGIVTFMGNYVYPGPDIAKTILETEI